MRKVIYTALFFCTATLFSDPVLNPDPIVIIENVLGLLNKGTNLIVDINTILRVDEDFGTVPNASNVIQAAREAANIVATIADVDPAQIPLGYMVVLLRARALVFNPIVDPTILARLRALNVQHLNGVVYVGNNTKADVLAAFFQPNRITYYFALPDDSAIPRCDGSPECGAIHYIPYEL